MFGSTYIVKELGPKNALVCGMALYCAYVAAFGVATIADESWISIIAACGAILGGTGAGFLWTAQGAYFAAAASEYQCAFRNENGEDDSDEEVETTREQSEEPSSQQLAGIFASIYLVLEVVLRALSTFLQRFTQVSWSATFGIYATIAIISTLGMTLVENPRRTTPAAEESQVSIWHKSTSACLLYTSPSPRDQRGSRMPSSA